MPLLLDGLASLEKLMRVEGAQVALRSVAERTGQNTIIQFVSAALGEGNEMVYRGTQGVVSRVEA
tara:strand:+ start:162 stop:356 length:195 start_codon:yes stop_codon:yes gene_type:complete